MVRWPLLKRDYAIFLLIYINFILLKWCVLIYINLKVKENAIQYTIQPDNKKSWNQRLICCFVWFLLREHSYNKFYIICTMHFVISYCQNNQCTIITKKVHFVTATYVSATKLPSSGCTPKNHSHSRHPDMRTFSITMKAHMHIQIVYITNSQKNFLNKLSYIF